MVIEEQDSRLFENHVQINADLICKSKTPPPPVVCFVSDSKVIVRPRRFESVTGLRPTWFKLFATQMTPLNRKVRITDLTLAGCGEQVKICSKLF